MSPKVEANRKLFSTRSGKTTRSECQGHVSISTVQDQYRRAPISLRLKAFVHQVGSLHVDICVLSPYCMSWHRAQCWLAWREQREAKSKKT